MSSMKIPLFAALLLAPLHSAALSQSRQAACYRYDSDSAALSGRVIRRVYPGRPNYESVKAGDEPDTVFVLQLLKPLCTAASPDHDAHTVREVQLYFSRDDAAAIRTLCGKSATFHGTLTGAVWGWHHLPVLFHVRLPRRRSAAHAV
jgi:hypothetical protein